MNTVIDLRRGVRAAVRSCVNRVQLSGVLLRAGVIALFVAAMMISPGRQRAQEDNCAPQEGCFSQPKNDLLFLIDASGSLEKRGQTYNLEVEGLLRALRDPAVIPRDGSIAVSVVVFSGSARVAVSLKDINTAADAEFVADHVEALKCANIHSLTPPCPIGATIYSAAIRAADVDATQVRTQSPKPGARRVMVLCSDGQPDDIEEAIVAANQARVAATVLGIPFEFDVILMGLNSLTGDLVPNPEYVSARALVDQLVSPQPADDLPGATLTIEAGPCNQEGAILLGADCERQADEFAANVRSIIRQAVVPQSIVVGTETDTPPGLPADGPLSLRQAIEEANCNGGATDITFDSDVKGKTINLLSPLSIAQPDVVIDGCDGPDCAPSITLDGGGLVSDGIVIRSNHVTVRGLAINNFTRSGILSTPVCPSDYISRNLIEKVSFDNNPAAVLVADEKTAPREGFNEQIKISHINASRAAQAADDPPLALIDLGGDGPTANDAGDADEGPNTLLNFPDGITVVSGAEDTVTITGQVSGPTAAGSTVEIYSITKSHILEGKLVIDGVAFLAEAKVGADCPPLNGVPACTFSATGVTPSPTGNYTATVIDSLGNTSELMFRDDGKPPVGPSASFTTPVDFGAVIVNSTPQSKDIIITNNGNAPLQITKCSLARCAPEDPDNTARFTIRGCPVAGTFIDPGESITVVVTFLTNICGPAEACLLLDSNDLFNSPIVVTLTGSVGGNAPPLVTLEGNATSLEFGPITARNKRINPKKFKKPVSRSFTVTNLGCNSLTLTFASIKRITDVDRCDISDANSDDTRLWVLSQVTPAGGTLITVGPNATVPLAPGQTLTFRVGFNPAVPPVVSSNCSDGNLRAADFVPDEVSSVLSILSAGGGSTPTTLTVPLSGEVTKEVRLINPSNPPNPPVVKLCRSGDQFIVEFSAYDANLNIDHATYQFVDAGGRTVGPSFDIALSQTIESRNLATGQSITVVQRFTGASDNSEIFRVQVTVFDGDGSQAAGTGGLTTGCSTAQSAPAVLFSSLAFRPTGR
jgi:Mg-chelatase subunit ChlD